MELHWTFLLNSFIFRVSTNLLSPIQLRRNKYINFREVVELLLYFVQDIDTLGVVSVRYCGYIAVAKVNHLDRSKVDHPLQPTDIKDQPEGGANALNINRSLSSIK